GGRCIPAYRRWVGPVPPVVGPGGSPGGGLSVLWRRLRSRVLRRRGVQAAVLLAAVDAAGHGGLPAPALVRDGLRGLSPDAATPGRLAHLLRSWFLPQCGAMEGAGNPPGRKRSVRHGPGSRQLRRGRWPMP